MTAPGPSFRDQLAEALRPHVAPLHEDGMIVRERAITAALAVLPLVEARVQAAAERARQEGVEAGRGDMAALEARWRAEEQAAANQRAAEALRKAADWIWDETPALASASAELHARADALDPICPRCATPYPGACERSACPRAALAQPAPQEGQ